MSKFNSEYNVSSFEGGAAFEREPLKNWLNTILSYNCEDGYYMSAQEKMDDYISATRMIIDTYGINFVCKAASFSRRAIGMRSISQLTAAILNSYTFENKRQFYHYFCRRPDDVAEIFGAVDMLGNRRSHALVRGCGDYLSSISDNYTLAKYKLTGKKYNMYDLINITHAHNYVIDKYKNNTLPPAETWENIISNSVDKNKDWVYLVTNNKLGYLALIRNLNNILPAIEEAAPNQFKTILDEYLVPALTNQWVIRSSLVSPLQIYTAYKNLNVRNYTIIHALEEAFLLSTSNIPNLEGLTMLAFDVSGSMEQPFSKNSSLSIVEVCAVYAAAFFVSNRNVDIIKFGDYAKPCNYSRHDSVFNLINKFKDNDECGYGTYINSLIPHMGAIYDRILLFSDMQVCETSYYHREQDFYEKLETMPETYVHSFDLGHYSSQCVPNNDHFHFFTSLSDKILAFIPLLEKDEMALYDYILKY
jgi:hypothetical protein